MNPISDKWISTRVLSLKFQIDEYPMVDTDEERKELRSLSELQRVRTAIREHRDGKISWDDLCRATLPEEAK